MLLNPRNTLWAPMIDAYKISRDLSKLDELFSEFELHEQTNINQAEKDIILVAGQIKSRESKSKSQPKSKSED